MIDDFPSLLERCVAVAAAAEAAAATAAVAMVAATLHESGVDAHHG